MGRDHREPGAPRPRRASRLIGLLATLAVGGAAPTFVGAQAAPDAATSEPTPTPGRSVVVQVDNDEFAGLNKRDRWYSQGLRLHVFSPLPSNDRARALLDTWCAWQVCGPGMVASQRWSIGQNTYTQNDRTLSAPDPQDRRNAGWLHLSGALLLESSVQTRMLEAQVGVIGPASLAGRVQNQWHRWLGVSSVSGWDAQLRPRAGLQIQVVQEQRWPLLGTRADLVGRLFGSLGTVAGQAGVGLTLRVGDRLSGTATYAEAQAATGRLDTGGRWSLQAGGAIRGVAYDRLIDGPVYGVPAQIRAAPWVGELHLAATVSPAPGWALRFALMRRSIDFDSTAVEQGRFKPQTIGSIQASLPLP